MPKRIRYSEDFKRDAVSQVIDRGYSVEAGCRETWDHDKVALWLEE